MNERPGVSTARAGSRSSARWYVGYLLAGGVASLAVATAFGFVPRPMLAVAISMPLWVAFVVGLSVWATRRPAAVRVAGVHLTVIVVWVAAWSLTVGMGTTVFPGVWPWWVGGGAVMAVTAFTGAWVTHRRTRPGA
ncbi:MAG TPA: hypothetical protein VF053_04300 [Streptosporangiales bacterium]